MPKRSSKPRRNADLNQLAKAVVDQTVQGDLAGKDQMPKPEGGKNPAAVALGRLGGKKGGAARAKALSEAQRVDIAKKAAETRWAKHKRQPNKDSSEQ